MANPEHLAQPARRGSVERGGLGQSGYTAGRREGDTALDNTVDTRRIPPPASGSDGLGTDERFTGRGGPPGEVERDGPTEAATEPYPHANGAPDGESSEPDGASGRRGDDGGDRDRNPADHGADPR
ncbi:MAG TPA: hypothetical protein VHW23_00840 [Kofleriaceae bacterium]|nr:hypothetical protein [Kofleriaceae bacterium]